MKDITTVDIFQRRKYEILFGDSCERMFWNWIDNNFKVEETKNGTYIIEPLREEKTNEN